MRKKPTASRKPISAETFVTHFPVPTVPFGVNAVPGGATPSTALPPISSGASPDKSTGPFVEDPEHSRRGDAGFDLNRLLVQHPAATFFLRAKGDALAEAGVRNGDVLIVDRSLEPAAGKLVVAVVNGEFTVQYFHRIQKKLFAPRAKNPASREMQKEPDVDIWGVVTYVIHSA